LRSLYGVESNLSRQNKARDINHNPKVLIIMMRSKKTGEYARNATTNEARKTGNDTTFGDTSV